jgi:hypothetical protein
MISTLALKDEVYLKYQEMDPAKPNVMMVKQLERFQDVKPTDRPVVLKDEHRKRIEACFGEGIDQSSMEKFLRWLERRSTVNVEGVDIRLSPSQMKAAEYQATFWAAKGGKGENPTAEFVAEEVRRGLYHTFGA